MKLNLAALSLGVALTSLVFSCSPGGGGGGSGGDGDGDDASSGGSSSGGASGGSSSGSGGASSLAEKESDLWVNVVRLIFSTRQSVQALAPPIDSSEPECETYDSADCTASVCPLTDINLEDNEYRHAGEITATFDVEEQVLSGTIVPGENGRYASANLEPSELLLLGGETGTVSADGGDIGAFTQDVTVPLVLLNTNPAQPTGASEYVIEAPRSQDLTLEWDRGAPGVEYLIQREGAIEDETSSYSLTCRFDSTLGSGTIPSELLSKLPSGSRLYTFTTQNYYQDVGNDRVLVRIATNTSVPAKDGLATILLTD